MPAYGEEQYWQERYMQNPVAFDWYQTYSGLQPLLQEHMPPSNARKILQIGVGTSNLQEAMVRQGGYQSITNIDISSFVIQHMSALHSGLPQLKYIVADCRSMPQFEDASFDGVIDKGTLDALCCGEKCHGNVTSTIKECYRVLEPGGRFVMVTYGDPMSRLHYFLEDPTAFWDMQVYVIIKAPPKVGGTEASANGNSGGADGAAGNGGSGASTALDASAPPTLPMPQPIIKGPFECNNVDAMEALSELENVHYVYCFRKVRGDASAAK